MTISLEKLQQIKTEAEGKSVNVFLTSGVCVSGFLSDVNSDCVKVQLDSTISYFHSDSIIAIQIF